MAYILAISVIWTILGHTEQIEGHKYATFSNYVKLGSQAVLKFNQENQGIRFLLEKKNSGHILSALAKECEMQIF